LLLLLRPPRPPPSPLFPYTTLFRSNQSATCASPFRVAAGVGQSPCAGAGAAAGQCRAGAALAGKGGQPCRRGRGDAFTNAASEETSCASLQTAGRCRACPC